MSASESSLGGEGQLVPIFATTHWSVVLAAGRSDTTRAQAALEQLCRTYWYPLYAYVRRRGHSAPDAQDLTQGFSCGLFADFRDHARRTLGDCRKPKNQVGMNPQR